jgi:anti-sigma regulatory factor (Ser/Thr protein kinase)
VDEAQQLAELRTALRAGLAARRVNDDTTDDLTLVLSELVGNGLRHGQAPLHLVATMRADPAQGRPIVRIQVTDGGRRTVPAKVVDAPGGGGRGLGIVAALSDDCGLEHPPGRGTVAWAERVVHTSPCTSP